MGLSFYIFLDNGVVAKYVMINHTGRCIFMDIFLGMEFVPLIK